MRRKCGMVFYIEFTLKLTQTYRYIGHGACGPVLNSHNQQDLSRRLLDSFRDGGGLGPLSRPSRSPTLAPAPAPLAADPAIAAVYQNHQEPRELRRMLADVGKHAGWINVGQLG
jgi:hypothetical protein